MTASENPASLLAYAYVTLADISLILVLNLLLVVNPPATRDTPPSTPPKGSDDNVDDLPAEEGPIVFELAEDGTLRCRDTSLGRLGVDADALIVTRVQQSFAASARGPAATIALAPEARVGHGLASRAFQLVDSATPGDAVLMLVMER